MKDLKTSRYDLRTDAELLSTLFSELNNLGINDLKTLEERIAKLQIHSFTDLLTYSSGSDCDPQIAVTIEELADRLRLAEPKREAVFTSSREVGNYLASKLVGHKQEEFWVLYLDNSNHIVAEKKISQGTLDRSLVHPRDVFRWAVLYNCASLMAVHNHPSGKLLPSQSDFKMTKDLQKIAELMKFNFLDHFIVGKNHY